MNCPTCKVPLVMSDRQGIEIDYCSQCRGIWLDRGELDKIIERSVSEPQNNFAPNQESYGSQSQQGQHREHKKKHWLNELFD
ncbi:TFIIB-type zinc ribbon-containing protein [Flavobacterium sp.]